jgi:hypothetical protein
MQLVMCIAGGNGNGNKGFIFKLPSDDESDDVMDADATHITQLSPGPSDPLSQYQQQQQQGQQQWWQQQSLGQQQQQQQQQMFVFAAAPSSQQGPVESMLQAHTRKLHVYALREAGERVNCTAGLIEQHPLPWFVK